MHDPLRLGGGRFSLTRDPGPPPTVVKRGPAGPLAHEAAALRRLAGVAGVPELVGSAEGVLVTALVPGAPREAAALGEEDARALGALLAEVHRSGESATAGLPWWDLPEPLPGAYAARRAAEAHAALAARGRRRGVPVPRCAAPFRPVHGDLVAANIVWAPAPHLVDWEFWHLGDPAEDLAYLVEVNDLGEDRAAALAEGYGDAAAVARAATWRAVVAAESAAWWLSAGRDDLAAPLLRRLGR